MKRTAGAMVLLALLGGCVTADMGMSVGGGGGGGGYMNQYWNKPAVEGDVHWGAHTLPSVAGMMGPNGEPIPRTAPYATAQTAGESAARAAFLQVIPPEIIAQTDLIKKGKLGGEVLQAAYQTPAGMPGMPGTPPAGMPGMPLTPVSGPGVPPPGFQVPLPGPQVPLAPGGCGPFAVQRTEVRFVGPNGMRLTWFAPTPDGKAGFGPFYLEAPARYNFSQAAIYRLKLSDIPNRPGVELYPTMEVVPTNARTSTFLAHSAVPVSFTEEDFAQVAAGNYVVKVIYLPDPAFQDLASTGPDEVVSSRLEPGVDPIAEAHRRGSILLVVRMGNIDLEAPNTPAMDAPNVYQARPPQAPPPGAGPGPMMPFGPTGGPTGMAPPAMMPPGMPMPGPGGASKLPPSIMAAPGAPVSSTMSPSNDGTAVQPVKFTPEKSAPVKSNWWSLSFLGGK